MTDLRARAEALLRLCERAPDLREFALPPGVLVAVIASEAAPLIRDLIAALPPDPAPTSERRPCAGWLSVVGKSDRILNLIPSDSDCGAVTLRVYGDGSWSVSALDGCETVHLADGKGGELAAEDAAADLLRAGLRALGCK